MAAIAVNPLDSYDLTVETKINIDEMIRLMNAEDLPMMGGLNSDGYPLVSKVPVDNTIFYWLEQDMPLPRTLCPAGATNVATTIGVSTGTGVAFAIGDSIRVGPEILLITGISTDTLTVTRGAQGTTGTAIAANAEVIGLGTYLDEGDVGDQQFRGRDKYSNYTQIWTSKIKMTRTSQVIPKYGVPSELGNLVRQVMLSEGVNMEQAALYGVKYQLDPRRATGGLAYFLANTIANGVSGNWLTVSEIEKRQQAAYDKGGMFSHIVSRPRNFAALNNVAGAERIQTVEVTDEYRGRQRAQVVTTEFGDVVLVRNRYVRASDAFGINPEDFIYRQMQPMIMQPLAKVDDRDGWMFVAEGGFEVKGQDHQVYWTGLDNTQALPSNLV